jgi:microcystin-dependent protein
MAISSRRHGSIASVEREGGVLVTDGVFIGQIVAVAFNKVPDGWVACNGQLLQISEHSPLFSLLGTTYGGDGVNTFAVPNLLGRVPIGQGQGRGLPDYPIGQAGGAETVTLLTSQIPAHQHPLIGSTTDGAATSPDGTALAQNKQTAFNMYADPAQADTPPDTALSGRSITIAGSSLPHENRQPFGVVNYIMATLGVMPQQGG